MGLLHDNRFPGESEAYRAARDALLEEERELRRHVERVAALRRDLPPGGALKEDYVFEEGDPPKETRFSELFADGKDTLVVYSFMYAPDAETPCPMCTSMLDSLNGSAPHVSQRVNLAVVAKAPIQTIRRWAAGRGWKHLRLLSSNGNTYNADYFGETAEGHQIPSLNVFRKTADGIHHTYNTELLFAPADDGQNNRHVDSIWPLWNLFDFTPEGRGTDWYPSVSYD